MEIVGEPVPDPTQFDPQSHYYDSKSPRENPRWLAVPVRHIATWGRVVSLTELRQELKLANLTILKAGNRLSITEITKEEYMLLKKMQ
jgi:predicted RNA-binding protein with PUA-like domain